MEKSKLIGKRKKKKKGYAVYSITKRQGRKDRGAPVNTSTNIRFCE